MKASSVSVLPPFDHPVITTPAPFQTMAAACSGTNPLARAVRFTIGTSSGTAGRPCSQRISQLCPICSMGMRTRVRALCLPRSTRKEPES
jgi:hypothetical protein